MNTNPMRPSNGRAEVVISTYGLTRHFPQRTAVANFSLTVYRGDVYGLLGPNGAGKTTIIAMLLGLVHPTMGRRTICGIDVAENPAEALQHVGATIEAPAFYPYLSGYDNARALGCVRGSVTTQRIDEVLAMVGLEGRGRDRYRTYSLGMKQRLAIGLALLHDPAVLILDEPTNSIDPRGMVEIRALITKLVQQGKTVVLCSHLLHEIEQVCNRVGILREGTLISEGAVAEIVGQRNLETAFLELTEVKDETLSRA